MADSTLSPEEVAPLVQITRMLEERDTIIVQQRAEIQALQKQLADLRNGAGVEVIIDGNRYQLGLDAYTAAPPPLTLNEEFLTAGPRQHETQALADSYILSKD